MRISFFGVFIILFACNLSSYSQDGLRKMTDNERINYVRKGLSFGDKTVFLDSTDQVLSRSFIQNGAKDLFPEYYINDQGEIRIIKFRLKKPSDEEFVKQYKKEVDAYKKRVNNWRYTYQKINCDSCEQILESLFDADQKYRKNAFLKMGPLYDLMNQNTLDNVVLQCDTSLFSNYSEKAVYGIWAVTQHSESKYIENKLPLIKQLVAREAIKETSLDMMLHRLGEYKKMESQD